MPPPDDVRGQGTRRTPSALLALAALLLVARVVVGVMDARHPREKADLVAWQPIAEAGSRAAQTGRPVLYEFSAAWCEPCRIMKREVLADPDAAAEISRSFVPVQVVDRQREDGHNPPDVQALEDRYHIDGFPMIVVVAPGIEPQTLNGYPGADETRRWLQGAVMRAHVGGARLQPGSPLGGGAGANGANAPDTLRRLR
jgi:thiol:disulfide interchange protein